MLTINNSLEASDKNQSKNIHNKNSRSLDFMIKRYGTIGFCAYALGITDTLVYVTSYPYRKPHILHKRQQEPCLLWAALYKKSLYARDTTSFSSLTTFLPKEKQGLEALNQSIGDI